MGAQRAHTGDGRARPSLAPAIGALSQLLVMLLVPALLLTFALLLDRGHTRWVEVSIGLLTLIGFAVVSFDAAAVALLLVSMALVQPFALGAGHTSLGSGVACAAGLAALVSDFAHEHSRAPHSLRSVLLWVTLSGAWVVMLSTEHPAIDGAAAWRSLEALVAVVGAAVLTLRSPRRRLWFSRSVVLVMAAFCASYCLTFALWLKDGFGSHVVGGITVRGYGIEPVFFPLTPTSGVTVIHGHLIPRLLGPLREPGLFQAVLIWSFFMLHRLGLQRPWLRILILVGVVATQSTAGLGILLVVWVLTGILMKDHDGPRISPLRHVAGLFVLVGALYVAVFAPAFGVHAKQEVNAASIDDRWSNTRAGLTTLVEAPLGRDYTDFSANVGINMLARTTIVGAPGLAFALLAFGRPMSLSGRRKEAVAAGLPLFLTAAVAQPVMDAPAYFVLLAASVVPYALVGRSSGDEAAATTTDPGARSSRSSNPRRVLVGAGSSGHGPSVGAR